MEELNEMDMSSSGWLTRFKTLKHDYHHHMDEEDSPLAHDSERWVLDNWHGKGQGKGQ